MQFEFYVLNYDTNKKKVINYNIFNNINVQEWTEKEVRKYLRSPKKYKHIFFQEEQHMLPVMPGVESPGIMALEKKDAAVTGAIRYDFISDMM